MAKKIVIKCKDEERFGERQGKRSEKVIRQLILTELSYGEATVASLHAVIGGHRDVIKRHLDALEAQGVILKKEGRSAYNRKEMKYYLAA